MSIHRKQYQSNIMNNRLQMSAQQNKALKPSMKYKDLFFPPQITFVLELLTETLEVIQGNFENRKAFWSSYLCDGIMCPEIRVQIWIKTMSEFCGFLAVKGEHNRIVAHMPCTSARSPASCQHQSVHRYSLTPFFHNTIPEWAWPISREDQKVDVQGEWNALIDWPQCFVPPAQSIPER